MIGRSPFLRVLEAARQAGRFDFARAAALDWLAAWPGDADVQLGLAQAELELGMNSPAAARLARLVNVDPESAEAYDLLATALRALEEAPQGEVYATCARALRMEDLDRWHAPSWGFGLGRALRALQANDPVAATKEIQPALAADPSVALPTVVAVRAGLAQGERTRAVALSRTGHDRWPECVVFMVVLAGDCLERGDTARGVEYLHRAAAEDLIERIVPTLLGSDHPYRRLWPGDMQAALNQPIPGEVAEVLGENRLAAGPTIPQATSTDAARARTHASAAPSGSDDSTRDLDDDDLPVPEAWESFRGPNPGAQDPQRTPASREVAEVRDELDRLAQRLKTPRKVRTEDTRLPAYVALSSRSRLIQEMGEDSFGQIDRAAMTLVEAVRRQPGWSGYRIYIDDPTTLDPFGLSPADPQNAWQIKLRLADLDRSLRRRGEMIGSVLIIGGEKIIPFHQLPNPTDDDDDVVPSDNPYATTDENYFAPEWPVGRIPWETDAGAIADYLRRAAEAHRRQAQELTPLHRLRLWLYERWGRATGRRGRALGYTANIWKKASLAVYKSIGDPGSLMTSPPNETGKLPSLAYRPMRMSYFNLHGLQDAPEWFGQRDPLHDRDDAPEFPVSLRPEDVVNGGRAPEVVFTEACYGAHAAGRTADGALCLKFLSSGSQAVVGSTKIAYGSLAPPLIAADLLGRLFWDYLGQALPIGEAFRRAKLSLAADMHQHQGYLDGEDQKTLISFVLYGDPLATFGARRARRRAKAIPRRSRRPLELKTACALGGPALNTDDLDPATAERIRSVVARYLPGMIAAQCRIHTQHAGCDGVDHSCPTHQLGSKAPGPDEPRTLQVTLSKQVVEGPRRHPHYARLTLDPAGKILKLAVSK